MKAGDVKKCLGDIISADRRESINPREYGINDNILLNAISAYQKGEPPEHLDSLINGLITTEQLTTARRVAVLQMVRSVLMAMANKNGITSEERNRLRSLLTAYFV